MLFLRRDESASDLLRLTEEKAGYAAAIEPTLDMTVLEDGYEKACEGVSWTYKQTPGFHALHLSWGSLIIYGSLWVGSTSGPPAAAAAFRADNPLDREGDPSRTEISSSPSVHSAIVFGVGLLAIWLFVSGPAVYMLNLVAFLHLFVVLMGYNARTIDFSKSKLFPSLWFAFVVAGSAGAVAMAVMLADGVSIGLRAAAFVYVLAFWAIVHRAAMAEVYGLLDTGNAE